MIEAKREPVGPGQESVWDYPRPPRLERFNRRIRVIFGGITIADTTRAWRVLETSHPPSYYLPPEDVEVAYLRRAAGASFCEWKGSAQYFDVVAGKAVASRAAWNYPRPAAAYSPIRDHFAFYPAAMEACYIDDEKVMPQPGGFYGGWITRVIVGPFKGEPGTAGW